MRWMLGLMLPAQVAAAPRIDAEVAGGWSTLLEHADELELGNVTVMPAADGSEHLVVAGTSSLGPTPTPREQIAARRVAELQARAAFARFAGSEVTTTQTATTRREVVTTTMDDGTAERTRHVQRALQEVTTERAAQLLMGASVVASWRATAPPSLTVVLSVPAPDIEPLPAEKR